MASTIIFAATNIGNGSKCFRLRDICKCSRCTSYNISLMVFANYLLGSRKRIAVRPQGSVYGNHPAPHHSMAEPSFLHCTCSAVHYSGEKSVHCAAKQFLNQKQPRPFLSRSSVERQSLLNVSNTRNQHLRAAPHLGSPAISSSLRLINNNSSMTGTHFQS